MERTELIKQRYRHRQCHHDTKTTYNISTSTISSRIISEQNRVEHFHLQQNIHKNIDQIKQISFNSLNTFKRK